MTLYNPEGNDDKQLNSTPSVPSTSQGNEAPPTSKNNPHGFLRLPAWLGVSNLRELLAILAHFPQALACASILLYLVLKALHSGTGALLSLEPQLLDWLRSMKL